MEVTQATHVRVTQVMQEMDILAMEILSAGTTTVPQQLSFALGGFAGVRSLLEQSACTVTSAIATGVTPIITAGAGGLDFIAREMEMGQKILSTEF